MREGRALSVAVKQSVRPVSISTDVMISTIGTLIVDDRSLTQCEIAIHLGISPIQTSNSNTIWPRFKSGNYDEPASVVAGSFVLQGGRGCSTVVPFLFWFCLHYQDIIQKSSEHKRRRSMIVKLDLVCLHDPKILRVQLKMLNNCQSWCDLPKISNAVWTPKSQSSHKWWCFDHESWLNRVRIAFCEWGYSKRYGTKGLSQLSDCCSQSCTGKFFTVREDGSYGLAIHPIDLQPGLLFQNTQFLTSVALEDFLHFLHFFLEGVVLGTGAEI